MVNNDSDVKLIHICCYKNLRCDELTFLLHEMCMITGKNQHNNYTKQSRKCYGTPGLFLMPC
jgi:hypothetical protein